MEAVEMPDRLAENLIMVSVRPTHLSKLRRW